MIFDSNLLIYLSQAPYDQLRTFANQHLKTVSDITRLEVLGFHRITAAEERFFRAAFKRVEVYEVRPHLIGAAIELRQQKRMSVGDAIIGATALYHGLTLATHNAKDFAWVDGPEVIDPLAT